MDSAPAPYTRAWYRTMEKINPLLTGLIRQRINAAKRHGNDALCNCAICGAGNADSHDLLMQGHIISLSSCPRCYALHGATFRANLLAAPPAGKTRHNA